MAHRACLLVLAVPLGLWAMAAATALADERPVVATGRSFRAALDRPIPAVRWSGVPFREAVRRVSDGDGLAVVIDRRIDPSREITFEATGTTAAGLLDELAAGAGGETRLLGSTVYLGPGDAAAKLRTLAALASQSGRQRGRTPEDTARRRTIRWDDLETPRGIAERIATSHGVPVDGLDAIPHDLWAAGTIAEATFEEALAIVLVQFDRTPAWNDDATRVAIAPMRESIGVERSHRTADVAGTIRAWRERFPEAALVAERGGIRMTALVEQHEVAERLLRGEEPGAAASTTTNDPSPLDRQRFTLTVSNVPASALLSSLERQAGVKIEYDAAALRAAGVDLDRRIDVTAEDATAEEFLHSILDPLKVEFEIDGTTVRLSQAE